MGCLHPSLNRIHTQPLFSAKEISCLNQSWNHLKSNDSVKFADQVILK